MTLVRWSPFRDMMGFQEEMNRMFNDFLSRSAERSDEGALLWNPVVDIAENEDHITVTAEFPGMTKDDIKISLQDNVLSLIGEKKQEKEEKKTNFHRIERTFGAFQRSFVLPTAVETGKVNAAMKDGVLTITLPKAEEAKPREIAIAVH